MTGGATSTATIGMMTVQEEASNGVATTDPETVTLTSTSNKGVFSSSPGGATVTSVNILAGQSSVSFYYGDTRTGTPTITASAVGLSAATQIETITPGALTTFVLSAPGNQTCGTAFNETITAEDSYGNTVTTYGGAQVLTFTGPSGAPNGTLPAFPPSVNFNNGVATGVSITLYDAQTTHLTATAGSATGSTGNFTVNAGATSTLVMSTPGTQTAGIQFTEPITATDNWGNTATSYAGTKAVTLSGPSRLSERESPFLPGGRPNHVQQRRRAGTHHPRRRRDGRHAEGHPRRTDGSDRALYRRRRRTGPVSAPNPGTQAAGTPFTVTVNATDTYGNVATSYQGNETLSFSGPANSPNGTAPSYPTPVSFIAGSATASVTPTTPRRRR